ncbi:MULTISPECIES: formate dehydrogenase subunit delta [Aliamphritea]|uniref:formate dehydrogenase subunit delta n=1 Tax=Aliamphritea TaxID=3018276 RepID=UPI00196A4C60|nr:MULTISPECIES: formate dehydrogenase subunit delta [Aliamphritea]MBN3563236.1 formate dehydrogenase subunit delta [Aliamphritea spongicola]
MGNATLSSLIKMVNQIADNNVHVGTADDAANAVASHITRFWARPMKQQINEYLNEGGEELNDIARQAVTQLQK